jgi:hypothetical protein
MVENHHDDTERPQPADIGLDAGFAHGFGPENSLLFFNACYFIGIYRAMIPHILMAWFGSQPM